jgi:hypothetical protein
VRQRGFGVFKPCRARQPAQNSRERYFAEFHITRRERRRISRIAPLSPGRSTRSTLPSTRSPSSWRRRLWQSDEESIDDGEDFRFLLRGRCRLHEFACLKADSQRAARTRLRTVFDYLKIDKSLLQRELHCHCHDDGHCQVVDVLRH